MADINTLPEDLVINILSRLPVKPLLFSKCVSKYWYGLIADANFMRRRSRHMVFLPLSPLSSIDVNDDSTIQVSDLLGGRRNGVVILGTIDGMVLLVVERSGINEIILYNPFTGASKLVPDPRSPFAAYGFGYGSSPKDLKVVEFKEYYPYNCRVFSFEGGSWSALWGLCRDFKFGHKAGIFLNGFVHWIAMRDGDLFIAALDMTKLVFTEMRIPAPCRLIGSLLDQTREGCLSFVCVRECRKVDMWVMKEYSLEGSWSMLFSVSLINVQDNLLVHTISVLGNSKIVMMEHLSKEIVIYDLEKVTYKKVKVGKNIAKPSYMTRSIEYVESLVSPSAYL